MCASGGNGSGRHRSDCPGVRPGQVFLGEGPSCTRRGLLRGPPPKIIDDEGQRILRVEGRHAALEVAEQAPRAAFFPPNAIARALDRQRRIMSKGIRTKRYTGWVGRGANGSPLHDRRRQSRFCRILHEAAGQRAGSNGVTAKRQCQRLTRPCRGRRQWHDRRFPFSVPGLGGPTARQGADGRTLGSPKPWPRGHPTPAPTGGTRSPARARWHPGSKTEPGGAAGVPWSGHGWNANKLARLAGRTDTSPSSRTRLPDDSGPKTG